MSANLYLGVRFGWARGVFAKLVSGFVLLFATLLGAAYSESVGALLFMTVIAAVGDGIVQSTLYALSAPMPPRYTGAIMVGVAVAGVLVAVLRIATKLSFPNTVDGALTARPQSYSLSFLTRSTLEQLAVLLSRVCDHGDLPGRRGDAATAAVLPLPLLRREQPGGAAGAGAASGRCRTGQRRDVENQGGATERGRQSAACCREHARADRHGRTARTALD